jgi:hypothetical protein
MDSYYHKQFLRDEPNLCLRIVTGDRCAPAKGHEQPHQLTLLLTSLKRSTPDQPLSSSNGINETTEPGVDPVIDDDASTVVDLVFDRQLVRLKEYMHVHGTSSAVAATDCREERFSGLNRFVAKWRFNARNIALGRTKQTPASLHKIRQLIELGIDLGTICGEPTPPSPPPIPTTFDLGTFWGEPAPPSPAPIQVTPPPPIPTTLEKLRRSRPSNSLEPSFQLLDQVTLEKSIEQNSQLLEYKDGRLEKLPSSPAFERDDRPATTTEENRPSSLTARKRSADQASLPSAALAGSPKKKILAEIVPILPAPSVLNDNPKTEPADLVAASRIRRLSVSLGTDACTTEKKQEIPGKSFSPTFDSHFQLLKEYKDTYGETAVLASQHYVGRFRSLNSFLSRWRGIADTFLSGRKEITYIQESMILQLIALGVHLDCRAGWERNLNLLQEYKVHEGSSAYDKTRGPIKKFRHLHVWCRIQQTQIRMYRSNPSISMLDESQYNLLLRTIAPKV